MTSACDTHSRPRPHLTYMQQVAKYHKLVYICFQITYVHTRLCLYQPFQILRSSQAFETSHLSRVTKTAAMTVMTTQTAMVSPILDLV